MSVMIFCSVTGHESIFSCCQNDNLRGLPVSFFMIHILGGMVLFMTDGIVVSDKCDKSHDIHLAVFTYTKCLLE